MDLFRLIAEFISLIICRLRRRKCESPEAAAVASERARIEALYDGPGNLQVYTDEDQEAESAIPRIPRKKVPKDDRRVCAIKGDSH